MKGEIQLGRGTLAMVRETGTMLFNALRLAAGVAAIPIVAATAGDIHKEAAPNLSAISSQDPKEFAKAAASEQQRFNELVQILKKVLEKEKNVVPGDATGEMGSLAMKNIAARLLGTLRAKDSASTLLTHLSEVKAITLTGPSLDPKIGRYTCALALIEIGDAAVPAIMESLTVKPLRTDQDVEIAAHVLERILGRDATMAKLQDALQKTDQSERHPLEVALKVLSTAANAP